MHSGFLLESEHSKTIPGIRKNPLNEFTYAD